MPQKNRNINSELSSYLCLSSDQFQTKSIFQKSLLVSFEVLLHNSTTEVTIDWLGLMFKVWASGEGALRAY